MLDNFLFGNPNQGELKFIAKFFLVVMAMVIPIYCILLFLLFFSPIWLLAHGILRALDRNGVLVYSKETSQLKLVPFEIMLKKRK